MAGVAQVGVDGRLVGPRSVADHHLDALAHLWPCCQAQPRCGARRQGPAGVAVDDHGIAVPFAHRFRTQPHARSTPLPVRAALAQAGLGSSGVPRFCNRPASKSFRSRSSIAFASGGEPTRSPQLVEPRGDSDTPTHDAHSQDGRGDVERIGLEAASELGPTRHRRELGIQQSRENSHFVIRGVGHSRRSRRGDSRGLGLHPHGWCRRQPAH